MPSSAPSTSPVSSVADVPFSLPARSTGNVLFVLILAIATSALLHVRSFSGDHLEGDELVYLGLARTMSWDLSRYDTKDVKVVQDFPYSIYRQPLFHHGPLYPLIIKFGYANGNAIETALLFANLCLWLLFGSLLLMQWVEPVGLLPLAGGLFFVALEPLLLFTTTRLLHDGTSGIFLAAGLLLYVLALDRRSTVLAVGAGLLFCAALNMRYNVLVAVPLIPLFQVYALDRARRTVSAGSAGAGFEVASSSPVAWPTVLFDPRQWVVFAIVAGLTATLGMQHFYRILATYGTLSPDKFIVPAPNIEELLPVVRLWNSQTRLQSLFHIAVMVPLAILPILPPVVTAAWRGWREGKWMPLLWVAYLYLVVCWMLFSHNQLRYFAICTPLLALLVPWMLSVAMPKIPRTMTAVGVYTLVSFLSLGYFVAVLDSSTGIIVPSIYELVPALRPLFMHRWPI